MVLVVNFGCVAFTPLVESLQTAFDAGPATVDAVESLVWLGSVLPADTRVGTFAAFSGLSIAIEATGSGVVGALVEAGYTFTTVFRGFAVGLAFVLALSAMLYRTGRLPMTDRVGDAVGARDRSPISMSEDQGFANASTSSGSLRVT